MSEFQNLTCPPNLLLKVMVLESIVFVTKLSGFKYKLEANYISINIGSISQNSLAFPMLQKYMEVMLLPGYLSSKPSWYVISDLEKRKEF